MFYAITCSSPVTFDVSWTQQGMVSNVSRHYCSALFMICSLYPEKTCCWQTSSKVTPQLVFAIDFTRHAFQLSQSLSFQTQASIALVCSPCKGHRKTLSQFLILMKIKYNWFWPEPNHCLWFWQTSSCQDRRVCLGQEPHRKCTQHQTLPVTFSVQQCEHQSMCSILRKLPSRVFSVKL